MTEKQRQADCEWADERLEPYLDGELARGEAGRVAAHLQECGLCRRELALAGRVRDSMRRRAVPACPGELADRLEQVPARRQWLRAAPVAAGLAAGVLAVAVLWQGPERTDRPSEREIAQARQELAVALGYIAKTGRMAGRDVGSVVARHGMLAPIQDGMKLELKLPVPERARSEQVES